MTAHRAERPTEAAWEAEPQEADGSDFAVLRAHLRLLTTPVRRGRGERVADREELLLDDEQLANELEALFAVYDRQRLFIAELTKLMAPLLPQQRNELPRG